MSTDLTTTIILGDDATDVSFRFIRTADGNLRIVACGAVGVAFPEEDAIMLRDWLNDEWPVQGTAEPEPEEYLWGGDIGWPQRGRPCPDCEKARGR